MRLRSRTFLPLALLLVACGGGDPQPVSGAGGETVGAAGAPAAALDTDAVAAAQAIYRKASCFGCHGHDAQGGLAGPTLGGLSAHWTAEELADFIQNPADWVAKDERIAAMAGEYAMPMARPMVPIPPAERLQLAEWLLTL